MNEKRLESKVAVVTGAAPPASAGRNRVAAGERGLPGSSATRPSI